VTIGSETVLLAKPETFMNLSGTSVRELVARHDVRPEEDLIVIQDELDFPLGTIRIQRKRSSAGHNGIESIISSLGTNDFLRIRMGVAPDRKVEDGMTYLLSPFRKAQLKVVDEMLEVAADSVKAIVTEGAAAAMNRFNRKVDTEKD
jgi:PTH1 family peptidyl-tRNA hydrolase